MERVVARIPLRAFKHWLTEKIGKLSPAMTLIVFVVPAILLFPLKLLGLWLLTHEYWISAVTMMVFAKFLGLGVTAFIFDVPRPKLLQMRWFATLYAWVLALRAKAAELVNPIKLRRRSCAAAARGGRRGCCGRSSASASACTKRGSPPRAGYIRCTACGANRPIAMKTSPVTAKKPATQASAIMPVMMVADASTMPI